jgi:superfamily I DNA and RNA helicase
MVLAKCRRGGGRGDYFAVARHPFPAELRERGFPYSIYRQEEEGVQAEPAAADDRRSGAWDADDRAEMVREWRVNRGMRLLGTPCRAMRECTNHKGAELMVDVVYGAIALTPVQQELVTAVSATGVPGTLYLGYPILNSATGNVELDAMLVSQNTGVVAFDLSCYARHLANGPDNDVLDRQDRLYAAITSKLSEEPRLVRRRELLIRPTIVSVSAEHDINEDDVVVSTLTGIGDLLGRLLGPVPELLPIVNSVLERTTTLRPKKARLAVSKADSKGTKLKRIEEQIANLDASQKRAAIEVPNGPQRIRGLAGSGKTIVLAMKASYLHLKNPEWRIAVTFYTRSLYQQLTRLVRRFSFEFVKDEPNWDRLTILHGWGSSYSLGMYAEMARSIGAPIYDFRNASQRFSRGNEFAGLTDELLKFIKDGNLKVRPIYDVVLVDEAQDFPQSFFELLYLFTKPPHRIVYAYDELQTLNDTEMPSAQVLFGRTSGNRPRVTLSNQEGQPKQDITLPVCYRNNQWSLTTAHGLGFGITRERGLVQMFETPETWQHIGYEVSEGQLAFGAYVGLKRADSATPSYFAQYLDEADAIKFKGFESDVAQYEWIADEIKKNLDEDEIERDDILVVFCDVMSIRRASSRLMSALAQREIASHLVGVTGSSDEVFSPNSVAMTHIHRAKGNEAPMVYVVGAEECFVNFSAGTMRNVLFTAITRSRAWTRVCGVGPRMEALIGEFQAIRESDYRLRFNYPTRQQLQQIRTRYKEISEVDAKAIEADLVGLARLAVMIKEGRLQLEDLPEELVDALRGVLTGDA